MADRRQYDDRELEALMVQATAAADLARVAGLELAGEIEALRAGQAGIEAARLRYKRGKDTPEADMVASAAKARAERGAAATAIGGTARKKVGEMLKRGEKPPPLPPTPPGAAVNFRMSGRVTEGSSGVAGLVVEARAANPVKTVASGRSGERGEFELEIEDINKTKQDLGRPAEEPLMLVLVALKERRIVARSDLFEAAPGQNLATNLKVG